MANKEFKKDLFLLTEDRYINPKDKNDYINNILLEDEILIEALKNQGLNSERKSWSDEEANWGNAEFLLFRTTWDYFSRFDEFKTWLNRIESRVKTINPLKTIRENIDKKYLLKMNRRGVEIPQTVLIQKGEIIDLKELIEKHQFEKAIIKPCIAGSARETYILEYENASNHNERINSLLQNEDFLLQNFESKVLDEGEVSLMYFGGDFTHAVLKRAKPGDFRVQDDFGGTVHHYEANKSLINFGKEVLSKMD